MLRPLEDKVTPCYSGMVKALLRVANQHPQGAIGQFPSANCNGKTQLLGNWHKAALRTQEASHRTGDERIGMRASYNL